MAWCYACEREETASASHWHLRCCECGHVYRSRRELRREYRLGYCQMAAQEWGTIQERGFRRELADEIFGLPPAARSRRQLVKDLIRVMLFVRADKIHFCPLCMHDFV